MTFRLEQNMRKRHDRHLKIASTVAGGSEEGAARKFLTQRVLLTGDPQRLRTRNGQLILRVAANLIARFCPRIDLAVPGDLMGLASGMRSVLQAIDRSASADFRIVDEPDYDAYGAVLSIGCPSTNTAVTTTVDGADWLALISQYGSVPRILDGTDRNPFGSLMAAALGAAEVFKCLLQPVPGKAYRFGDATFSAFDYATDGLDPGPRLAESIALPQSMLVGIGAVGNAALLSLACLENLSGELIVVDREAIDDLSNLNRYVLAFEEDVNLQSPLPKTQLAVRLFQGSPLSIKAYQETVDQVLGQVYSGEIGRPRVILSAVDNNPARASLQKAWPDLLLEGATGGTTSQVSRHEYGKALACLLCIHTTEPERNIEFSYTQHAAYLSGLREDRIAAAHRETALVVTEQDVREAPMEKKPILQENIGKSICSVLTEIESLSSQNPNILPVQPAVSFVSMISGLLMVGELVKYAAGAESPLETLFQIDSLFPLSNTLRQPVEKTEKCPCTVRKDEIERYRMRVQAQTSGSHLN